MGKLNEKLFQIAVFLKIFFSVLLKLAMFPCSPKPLGDPQYTRRNQPRVINCKRFESVPHS